MNQEQFLGLTLKNQCLLNPVPKFQVIKNSCGLQAQFFNYPKFTLKTRAIEKDNDWTKGLIKTWALRGTVHLINPQDFGLFMSVKSDTTYFDSWFNEDDIKFYGDLMLECINSGISQKKEIAKCIRQHFKDEKKFEQAFSGWGGLFYILANRGKIIFDSVTTRGFMPAPKFDKLDYDKAMLILLKRYFEFYSPATLDDCAVFFRKTKAEIKRYLKELDLQELEFEDKIYYAFSLDYQDIYIPEIIFLAGFDPMLIGYKDRSRAIDRQFYRGIFTTTGLILPSVMYNGRIVAKWKENAKSVEIKPFIMIDEYLKKQLQDYVINTFRKTIEF